jgi:hypothetical protein
MKPLPGFPIRVEAPVSPTVTIDRPWRSEQASSSTCTAHTSTQYAKENRMKIRSTILAFTLALPFLSTAGEAQRTPVTPAAASAPTAIPALVPYAGAAAADDGKPLPGEATMTFLIYKEEQGGEPLWVESQTVGLDSAGHYKVQLGAANPSGLPSDLFSSGQARWLEVQIAGQPAEPRVLLASVPYALKAADAATLGGLPASAFALAGSGSAINATAGAAGGLTPDANSTVTTPGGIIRLSSEVFRRQHDRRFAGLR